jgi:predicted ATPase
MEHPFQLRRIDLRDFKSVSQASVSLRPLTVVVGANSSGKSTLLQAILAVTQAVRAGTGTAEFPLNGEFVRLGTFDETRNFLTSSDDRPLSVAFELVDTVHPPSRPRGLRSLDADVSALTHMVWRAQITDARAGAGSTPSGFARLMSLEIDVGSIWPDDQGDVARILTCEVTHIGEAIDRPEEIYILEPRLTRIARPPLAASGRVQDWVSGAATPIHAVSLAGGVPQSLMSRTNEFHRLANMWWRVAQELFSEELQEQRRTRPEDDDGDIERSPVAVRQASDDIEALKSASNRNSIDQPDQVSDVESRISPGEDRLLYRRLGKLNPRRRVQVVKSMAELGEDEFRRLLHSELSTQPWVRDEVLVNIGGPAGEALWRCGAASQRFFRSSVRYLGPLREAPHVLYDPGPSKLDLGVRGEYAAAVLHAQARTIVLMPTPAGTGVRRHLTEALNFWLSEFGLAESARSEDRGRIGIGLSVRPAGADRDVDLTSVGVGVSQILPVILLCLLAEPGSLLILEQPELHLHPKLQQDLADFLLACARSGRQLVVETHSEHLINRLRYRIADDDSADTHQLIGLVFAENDSGITTYREPEINVYGGLGEDWPAGFLDLTARESQELVRQSLAKRRRDAPVVDHD